jgi:glycosyltransferase involved in cell wall biosynthesis
MKAEVSNTIVILPSYNESRAIGKIVKDIAGLGMTALVIDDGSVDDTGGVALDAGAIVIRNKVNKGKGYCVRVGIDHVMKKTTFDWIIIMDGDGQHHTEDIPAFMKATGESYVDIVNGNRMFNTETMPLVRYVTNRFTSWMISRLCKQYIPDSQCGYRMVSIDALKHLNLCSDKYDIESEMLIQAAEKNMVIKSVPIQTIYGEEKSEINKIRDTLRFFALIMRHKFKKNE